jgi:unsaturated chondroitin disaccharide hydrolase
MMNLPLLYWASEELKDPRFKEIAVAHANTAMKNFVREDGSVRHIVGFDPFTGEFDREYAGQGYSEGSSWTRGQSWGIYGFTLSYIYTGDEKYLETAQKIAEYILSDMPETFLVPIDYRQPKEDDLEDSTAAAITAGGFIELSKCLDKLGETDKAEKYLEAAVKLLKVLDGHSCDYTLDRDNILTRGSVDYHGNGHHIAIIYGDYYYIEALMKLTDTALTVF